MPIKIPESLPAYEVLQKEGVMIMSNETAERQDIRPLRLGLLNLMPQKIQTETQFARLVGATPLQIELVLISISNHKTKNTSEEHMESFYKPFSEIKSENFDGLIITGAPIEHLEFDQVTYWKELVEIFEWSQTNVHSTFAVCWGGMAMLNYFHNIRKYSLSQKAFGCFRHKNLMPQSPFLRGFSDDFIIPVSRWSTIKESDIYKRMDLEILITSNICGPCLIEDKKHNSLYLFNHLEYDTNTLKEEYERDVSLNRKASPPENYFPENNPLFAPENRWRSHAHLLYGNWINQIYQTTPFNIQEVSKKNN